MNKVLQDFARFTIKAGLMQLPESNFLMFKRMYSHTNLDADINSVVDNIPYDKLDWAMRQVQTAIVEKHKKEKDGI